MRFIHRRRKAMATAVALAAIALGGPALAGPASAGAAPFPAPGAGIPCYPFPASCSTPLPGVGGTGGTGLPFGGHGPGPAQPGGSTPALPYPGLTPGLPYPGPTPGLPFPGLPGFPLGR